MSGEAGIRWLAVVLSENGPPSATTRLVLCAVFQRIDWTTGQGCFEGARSLALRTGLSKDTVTLHLTLATEQGWLTRTPRAKRGDPRRRGFDYTLAYPDSLSDQTRHSVSDQIGHTAVDNVGVCPISQVPLSELNGQCVLPDRPLCPTGSDVLSSDSLINHLPTLKTVYQQKKDPERAVAEAQRRTEAMAASIRFRKQNVGETFEQYAAAVVSAAAVAKVALMT